MRAMEPAQAARQAGKGRQYNGLCLRLRTRACMSWVLIWMPLSLHHQEYVSDFLDQHFDMEICAARFDILLKVEMITCNLLRFQSVPEIFVGEQSRFLVHQ